MKRHNFNFNGITMNSNSNFEKIYLLSKTWYFLFKMALNTPALLKLADIKTACKRR